MTIPVVFPCVIWAWIESYIRLWHQGGPLLAVIDLGISAAPLSPILAEFWSSCWFGGAIVHISFKHTLRVGPTWQMVVSLWALKAGLKTVNIWRSCAFFFFKYFIFQLEIIHWINMWTSPIGKRLAVRIFPVFLLERRLLMLGATVLVAWLALRKHFLQR